MNFKLSNLLFLFLPMAGFSQQEINIQIHQDLFYQAEKSLLILSDSLGEVVSYKIITDAHSINERYDLEFKTQSNGVKHFTIVNEYLKKKDIRIMEHFVAITYANIPDLLRIEPEEMLENSFSTESEMKSTVLFIKGVDVLNDIEVFEIPMPKIGSRRRSYYYQKRRKILKINWTDFKREDIYVYMRCNDEDEYRFLYIPSAEINAKMNFDFSDLQKGLDTISIDIENWKETQWWSSLKFKNDASNNTTHLNYLLDEDFEYPLRYLIPKDDSFYDFELTISPIIKGDYFSYNFKDEGISPFIKINPLEMEPEIERDFDEQSIKIVDYNEPYEFDNFILYKTMIGKNGTYAMSNWEVKGKLEGDILNFQYPNIDEYLKGELRSLEMVNNIVRQYYQLKTGEEKGKSISITGVKKDF